jgi:hypothetical protein
MRHTRETIAAMFGSIRAVANLTRGAVLRAISHIRRQPRLGSMSYRFCQNDDRRAGLMMRATTANKYGPPDPHHWTRFYACVSEWKESGGFPPARYMIQAGHWAEASRLGTTVFRGPA